MVLINNQSTIMTMQSEIDRLNGIVRMKNDEID